jgi:hypothetical protein
MNTVCREFEWFLLLKSIDDFIDYLKDPAAAKVQPSLPLLPQRLNDMLDCMSEEDFEREEQDFIRKLVTKDEGAWAEFLCEIQKNPTADQRYKELNSLSPLKDSIVIPVTKNLGGIVVGCEGLRLVVSNLLAGEFRNVDFSGVVVLKTKGFVLKQ